MLRCPVCEKLYKYESKICTECEEDAVRSGLVKKEPVLNDAFHFIPQNRFGKVEHHEYRVRRPLDYGWNCNSTSKMEVEIGNEFFFDPIEFSRLSLDKRANLALYFE